MDASLAISILSERFLHRNLLLVAPSAQLAGATPGFVYQKLSASRGKLLSLHVVFRRRTA